MYVSSGLEDTTNLQNAVINSIHYLQTKTLSMWYYTVIFYFKNGKEIFFNTINLYNFLNIFKTIFVFFSRL